MKSTPTAIVWDGVLDDKSSFAAARGANRDVMDGDEESESEDEDWDELDVVEDEEGDSESESDADGPAPVRPRRAA